MSVEEKSFFHEVFADNEHIRQAIRDKRLHKFELSKTLCTCQSSPIREKDSALEPADVDNCEAAIDFVICLGGDGTLLHVSSLFQVRPFSKCFKVCCIFIR